MMYATNCTVANVLVVERNKRFENSRFPRVKPDLIYSESITIVNLRVLFITILRYQYLAMNKTQAT